MTEYRINLNKIKGKIEEDIIRTDKDHFQLLPLPKLKHHNDIYNENSIVRDDTKYPELLGTLRKVILRNQYTKYWHWHPEWCDVRGE